MPEIITFDLDTTLTVIDVGTDLTVVSIDLYAGETDFTVVDLGPAGIIPPVASFHTVSILSQRLTITNGSLLINREFGEYVVVTVRSNIGTFQVLNWPPAPFLGRIMLETINDGGYTIIWPEWIRWSRGRAPDLTVNGIDRFLFTSVDNGASIKGDIVGMDYVSL